MTEAEWLAATELTQIFGILWNGVSDRKLRLFAVACCRQLIAGTSERTVIAAVEASERFADGEITEDDLGIARDAVTEAWTHVFRAGESVPSSRRNAVLASAYQVSRARARKVVQEIGLQLRTRAGAVPREIQVGTLRDILGNPFRAIAVVSSWLSPTVITLAEGIYRDRAFDRLLILADALQDAGCEQPDILNHCRSDGPHVRGCWVVDLLTGRN